MNMDYFKINTKRKLLVAIGIALILIWVIAMIANPIRRPRFMVRHYVLRLTPMGTHIGDVIEILENNKQEWSVVISYEHGFVLPTAPTHEYTTGEMSIRVFAGRYWPSNWPIMGLLMETTVSIFWGFDEDGNLTDIYVWKGVR